MADLEKGQNRIAEGTAALDKSITKRKPRSNCLSGFCRLVNFLTAVCATLCAVAHGMALMLAEGSDQVQLGCEQW